MADASMGPPVAKLQSSLKFGAFATDSVVSLKFEELWLGSWRKVGQSAELCSAHVTRTLVTVTPAMLPALLATRQACPRGGVRTVTEYGAPSESGVGNAKTPFAETLVVSAPSS